MTKREIASLVIKLMGVFILIRSLIYLPMTIGNVFTVGWQDSGEWIATVVLMGFLSVLPPIFSLAIILLSDKIAGWLIKDNHPIELIGSVRKEDVMVVVFTCIGLYLIITGIPSLIAYLSTFLMFQRARSGVSYSGGIYNASRLIGPIVQIGLGVWLFAGSKGIVKLWQKIRSRKRKVIMAKCPHCEKTVTLKKGEPNQIHRQTEGTAKKEVMYFCPHCEKVIGFAFFLGGMLTGRP